MIYGGNAFKMKIILASGSPRRKEILKRLGYEFEIIKAENEEITDKIKPCEVVEELSYNKAIEVKEKVIRLINSKNAEDDYCIIAADTVVAVDNQILGKPSDRNDAFNTIKLLQGRKHQVYTGVTIINLSSNKVVIFSDKTDVYVKKMSDSEIWDYVECGECDDKAGSYAIQGVFSKYIERYEGDYDNVVGLPAKKVDEALKNIQNVSVV